MKSKAVKTIALLCQAYRTMAFTATLWVVLPILSGLILILIARSQIDLINNVTQLVSENSSFNLNKIFLPAVWIAVASMINVIVSACKNIVNTDFVEKCTLILQSKIVEHAMKMPMEHYDNTEYADKLQRARSASQENLSAIFNNLMYILQYLVNLISILIILSSGFWLLSALTLLITTVSLITRVKIEIEIRTLNHDLTFEGRMADYLKAELARPEAMKELRTFGSIDYLLNKWHRIAQKQNNARARLRRREIHAGIILCVLASISMVVTAYLLIIAMKKGTATTGLVAITFQKFIEALGLSFKLSFPISKIYLLGSKIRDIIDFLLIEIPQKEFYEEDITPREKITFDKVSFKYPSSGEAQLKNISFSIVPGETIALVGENGAGKSTLVNLLLGIYSPEKGRITWGARDYSSIKPELLYKHISVVFQDFEHYQLSLSENLSLGSLKKKNQVDINAALQKCGISDIASDKEGLNTMLGRLHNGGKELSGGQWQRLSIARAMVKDSDLVILDEPNSALDPQAELELFKQIKKLTEGKTTIFVSHRLGWARHSDRIFVLDRGELIECGSHDELIKRGGKYAATFELQASWYKDGNT